ncbi:efflux RND transporter periplasmic adaptor subunit [Ignavibacterium album]|nr:efflux RND transporter periplasmic adaptor subunit [Ignavibacterium album]
MKDSLIQITKAQFETEKMQIGDPVLYDFEDVIKSNGYISSPPNGKAQISTQIPGIVKNISKSIGDYVEKGSILCTIESNEIIMIQQDFIETANKLKALTADYNRMKTLNDENITSQKNFMTVESEYKNMQAKYNGLKARIEMLKLNPNNIQEGNVSSSINLYSPINGYITMQNCLLGQYIEPQQVLMQVVDVNKLYLQFFVFEKDIAKLKIGQKVYFYSSDNKSKTLNATVTAIGKSINSTTKSIECKAVINNDDKSSLLDGMYVNVNVVTTKSTALSLPTDAIIKSGNDNFVLQKEKEKNGNYYFIKKPIKIGMSLNGFTEIIDDKNLKNVLIKGIYNLKVE